MVEKGHFPKKKKTSFSNENPEKGSAHLYMNNREIRKTFYIIYAKNDKLQNYSFLTFK